MPSWAPAASSTWSELPGAPAPRREHIVFETLLGIFELWSIRFVRSACLYEWWNEIVHVSPHSAGGLCVMDPRDHFAAGMCFHECWWLFTCSTEWGIYVRGPERFSVHCLDFFSPGKVLLFSQSVFSVWMLRFSDLAASLYGSVVNFKITWWEKRAEDAQSVNKMWLY